MKISRISIGDIKRIESILYRKLCGTTRTLKKRKCENYGKKRYKKRGINLLVNDDTLALADKGRLQNERLIWLAERYCKHEIDYLGSGWVSLNYGNEIMGMEGKIYEAKYNSAEVYFEKLYSNIEFKEQKISLQIRSMLGSNYQYIQWNRDYKSGFSWEPDYLDVVNAVKLPHGADIKTVWEVSRLEFLVQLSLAAVLVDDDLKRNEYITEFKNIVYDFIACNPVGVGCCWIYAMEAGIRAINLLIAHSIIKKIDKCCILDEVFEELFEQEIILHGYYIWDNLEKGLFEKSGANHYYSDIVGLLYVGYALDKGDKHIFKKWKKFATKEFFRESFAEFHSDGTNVECSTGYHCLMTELLVFGCALLERFQIPVPDSIKEKVVQAASFIQVITKKNGNIVQIGDNDCGRVVTIRETSLDKSATLAYCRGLYVQDKVINESRDLETMLVQAISNRNPQTVSINFEYRQTRECMKEKGFLVKKETVFHYDCTGDKVEWGYYPDFGLYFYRQGNLDFYMYTGGDGGRKWEGHSHNDILHCEIQIDGKDVIADPGTYVYICLERGRMFRSRLGHFVPDYGVEPRKVISAWKYKGEEKAEVVELDCGRIIVRYQAVEGQIEHERSVFIAEGKVTITDRGMREFVIHDKLSGGFAKGYGEIEER